MIIGRHLRVALLISLFWHLFWMFFVSIVFLPNKFDSKRYSPVCFLGSILISPLSAEQLVVTNEKNFTELPAEANIQKQNLFYGKSDVLLSLKREIFKYDGFIDVDIRKEREISFEHYVSAVGSSGQREVVFRPPFPKYPEWAQQEIRADFVIFNIYISADGLVQQPTVVQASGNPEIDAALARYVRKWRFAPSADLQGYWQTVKINLDFNASASSPDSAQGGSEYLEGNIIVPGEIE